MLRDHIIPVAEKLRQEAHHTDVVEEHYLQEKRKAAAGDTGDAETNVKEVGKCLCLECPNNSFTIPSMYDFKVYRLLVQVMKQIFAF